MNCDHTDTTDGGSELGPLYVYPLLLGAHSQAVGLLDVHVLGIVLALEVAPLGRLVVDDVPQDTLGSPALLLAALAALGAEGVGKDT